MSAPKRIFSRTFAFFLEQLLLGSCIIFSLHINLLNSNSYYDFSFTGATPTGTTSAVRPFAAFGFQLRKRLRISSFLADTEPYLAAAHQRDGNNPRHDTREFRPKNSVAECHSGATMLKETTFAACGGTAGREAAGASKDAGEQFISSNALSSCWGRLRSTSSDGVGEENEPRTARGGARSSCSSNTSEAPDSSFRRRQTSDGQHRSDEQQAPDAGGILNSPKRKDLARDDELFPVSATRQGEYDPAQQEDDNDASASSSTAGAAKEQESHFGPEDQEPLLLDPRHLARLSVWDREQREVDHRSKKYVKSQVLRGFNLPVDADLEQPLSEEWGWGPFMANGGNPAAPAPTQSLRGSEVVEHVDADGQKFFIEEPENEMDPVVERERAQPPTGASLCSDQVEEKRRVASEVQDVLGVKTTTATTSTTRTMIREKWIPAPVPISSGETEIIPPSVAMRKRWGTPSSAPSAVVHPGGGFPLLPRRRSGGVIPAEVLSAAFDDEFHVQEEPSEGEASSCADEELEEECLLPIEEHENDHQREEEVEEEQASPPQSAAAAALPQRSARKQLLQLDDQIHQIHPDYEEATGISPSKMAARHRARRDRDLQGFKHEPGVLMLPRSCIVTKEPKEEREVLARVPEALDYSARLNRKMSAASAATTAPETPGGTTATLTPASTFCTAGRSSGSSPTSPSSFFYAERCFSPPSHPRAAPAAAPAAEDFHIQRSPTSTFPVPRGNNIRNKRGAGPSGAAPLSAPHGEIEIKHKQQGRRTKTVDTTASTFGFLFAPFTAGGAEAAANEDKEQQVVSPRTTTLWGGVRITDEAASSKAGRTRSSGAEQGSSAAAEESKATCGREPAAVDGDPFLLTRYEDADADEGRLLGDHDVSPALRHIDERLGNLRLDHDKSGSRPEKGAAARTSAPSVRITENLGLDVVRL
ncbi:unnamed protein product [Amoebophrya sp. A120]|nr:unnamed protein product [Amoebophrya sp. A120]|eukprot:GSA120T00015602001.1